MKHNNFKYLSIIEEIDSSFYGNVKNVQLEILMVRCVKIIGR